MFTMKYTEALLQPLVEQTNTYSGLARLLNLAPVGSTVTYLRKRCELLGLNVSHFVGQASNKGKPSFNKKSVEEILVLGKQLDRRAERHQLMRAPLELGIEYKCAECTIHNVWNGKPLTLQIDHINGQYWDNRIENLRFLCPNCHTQTVTWGTQNIGRVA